MIDSLIKPLIDQMQLSLLALHETEKLQYVAHSEDPMTPVPKRVVIQCL